MAYVVVGASAAGINAAKTLREINKDIEIILVSKDEHVYSRCILHHFLDGRRNIDDLDFSPAEFFEKYDVKWIKGVEVTLLVKEADDKIKASLRSKNDVDVRKIAEYFGGGGHTKAAGLAIKYSTLEEARDKILSKIEEEL